jgi:uncharacterized protein (DUF433 family)
VNHGEHARSHHGGSGYTRRPPCIHRLRIRKKDILDTLAGDSSRAEILSHYPYLEDNDITAAPEFASRATDHPVFVASEL